MALMFERYDEAARRALFFARYEASQLGSKSIEPEHLLLGVLRQPSPLVHEILAAADVTTAGLRTELEAATAFHEKLSTAIEIPFSPACKRVLEFCSQEAESLGHRHIGVNHLLLGILREETSAAAHLLHQHGIRLAAVRDRVTAGPPKKTTLRQSVEVPGGGRSVDADELKRRIKAVRDALDDLERFLLS
jgi:ATP-dependent Clp protease ATP-binding subunit ClpC